MGNNYTLCSSLMPVRSEGHPVSDVMCGLSPSRATCSSEQCDPGMAGPLHPPFRGLGSHGEARQVLVGGSERLSGAAEWLSTWGALKLHFPGSNHCLS